LYIGFIEKTEVLLTLDKEGKIFIWSYDHEFYGSDGNFTPKERFKYRDYLI
jgi:hypothetical protein